MDRGSYRFVVNCLGYSIVLIVIASIAFGFLGLGAAQLVPVLAPIMTLLGGLLVMPPDGVNNGNITR